MRKHAVSVLAVLGFVLAPAIASNPAQAADQANLPEWTFMVFLNGKNNLDSFGSMNINQMEQVGSNANLNIVVQWGSSANGKVQRLLVKKDNDTNKVTSPIVQDMGNLDMGDYKNLTEFVKWTAEHYPAKHYFLNVWDHGSGWHDIQNLSLGRHAGLQPNDISWDEDTGSFMTTEQLGQAVRDASAAIGQKIDIYGSDACLMAMAEVADEMSGSVDTFVGSQEVEPAEGWPYTTFLTKWAAKPTATAQEVGGMLAQDYVKAYQPGGIYSQRDATFSVFKMDNLPALKTAIGAFGAGFGALNAAARAKIRTAASSSQSFTYDDYVDVTDFIVNVEKANIRELDTRQLSAIKDAVKAFVPFNFDTTSYKKATGVSFWAPNSSYSYDRYASRYAAMNFGKTSGWSDALAVLLKDAN